MSARPRYGLGKDYAGVSDNPLLALLIWSGS